MAARLLENLFLPQPWSKQRGSSHPPDLSGDPESGRSCGGSGRQQPLHRTVSHLNRDGCAFIRDSLPATARSKQSGSSNPPDLILRVAGARGGSGKRQPLHRTVSRLTKSVRDLCYMTNKRKATNPIIL